MSIRAAPASQIASAKPSSADDDRNGQVRKLVARGSQAGELLAITLCSAYRSMAAVRLMGPWLADLSILPFDLLEVVMAGTVSRRT